MKGADADPVAVLGAGSWGTALAVLLARRPLPVRLLARDEEAAAVLSGEGENRRYLPGVRLPAGVAVSADPAVVLAGAGMVVSAVPAAATAAVAARVRPHLEPAATWVSAAKGLEPGTRARPTEVARRELPGLAAVAALSGPSFAVEVAAGQPTAVVIAASDLAVARRLQEVFSGPRFRAYASADLVGVEMGGALKNVIAIAAGLIAGLGLGHDPLAALVTRGLAEMTRLAVAMGGEPRTLAGLSGLGDLVLTCTGPLSRNRRLGELVAGGLDAAAAERRLGQVAEGVRTARLATELAAERGVDMPIAIAVRDVLDAVTTADVAVERLMRRQLKDEWE